MCAQQAKSEEGGCEVSVRGRGAFLVSVKAFYCLHQWWAAAERERGTAKVGRAGSAEEQQQQRPLLKWPENVKLSSSASSAGSASLSAAALHFPFFPCSSFPPSSSTCIAFDCCLPRRCQGSLNATELVALCNLVNCACHEALPLSLSSLPLSLHSFFPLTFPLWQTVTHFHFRCGNLAQVNLPSSAFA